MFALKEAINTQESNTLVSVSVETVTENIELQITAICTALATQIKSVEVVGQIVFIK